MQKNYIDLIKELSEKDKTILNNYISLYGINHNFIGLDKWLQNWSHSNQRLYKLLGGAFIKEYPYTYTKDEVDLSQEFEVLIENHPFIKDYERFIRYYLNPSYNRGVINEETINLIRKDPIAIATFALNFFPSTIKVKKKGANKILQIQEGAKPLRALTKIIEYFKDDYTFDIKAFEDFKTQCSIILTNKVVSAKICLSIHPMDFLTMSDNDSNWTSCMSWRDEGCYHEGTIEMMNSNNVLCCYLKNNKDNNSNFFFGKEGDKKEDFSWNNKRWRVLAYVHKDIIMSGKAYPYQNDIFEKFIISNIKNLAKENLHWNYTFGPELYKDMIHINSLYAMDNNRDWISMKKAYKKNIIFDTKGMYNDMLNANRVNYWCYRNKVDHNKIISVSGKAPCLCCGESIIIEKGDENYEDDYNERFFNTGASICETCISKLFRCHCCDNIDTRKMHYIKRANGEDLHLCNVCYNKYIKICPNCGKVFYLRDLFDPFNGYDFNKDDYCFIKRKGANRDASLGLDGPIIPFYMEDWYDEVLTSKDWEDGRVSRVLCCSNCQPNTLKGSHREDFTLKKYVWGEGYSTIKTSILLASDEVAKKYCYNNLKSPKEEVTELL